MAINCRNRVTLTEEQLKQIISDSVKQCLAELSKPFACEKYGNGENIDFNALKFPIKSYNDEDFIQREINEGLIPKSNNSLFLFPDRIYCMKGDNLTYLQKTQLKSIQDKRNSTEPYLRNPNDKLEYVLLKIDLTKISDDVRFYNDPAAPRAVFCHDNIPVSAIVEIIPFSL